MPPKGSASSTTTNLLQLLPNYTASTLPKQVVDLAVSLYSQSKARAAVLKKDEEVAREYACCVLAVERLKNPLNLPIDKLEPRPPVQPRVFDRLLRFLDKAIPAASDPTKKRRGRPPGVKNGESKRAREEAQLDPALDQQGPVRKKRKAKSPPRDPNSLTDVAEEPILQGVPRWLPKYLRRIRPKLQEQMPEHSFNRILHDEKFLLSVVATGVKTVREGTANVFESDTARTTLSADNGPAIVIAVLTVVLQWHLGPSALDVAKFARFCTQELAAGGVVKTVAFGAVYGDARDLAEEKRDEWEQTPWCTGEMAEAQPKRRISSAHPDGTDSDVENGAAQKGGAEADEGDASEEDEETTRVLRSRAGPMAQAQPDMFSPAKKREYAQWKSKTLKRATAVGKEQYPDPASEEEEEQEE